jgi:hypothetical protein
MSLSVVAHPEVMSASKGAALAGRLLATLVVLFLLFDGSRRSCAWRRCWRHPPGWKSPSGSSRVSGRF